MSDLKSKDQGDRQVRAPAEKPALNMPEGQQVRNASGDMGVGTIVRICQYQTVGLALYVDFANGLAKIIGIDYLEKVKS